jgi:FkbM family methyltransferase
MYLRKFKTVFGVHPSGILHVGAHLAEELDEYEKNNFFGKGKIYWIEGQKELFKEIVSKLDHNKNVVIEAFAWDVDGVELTFNVTNKSASSSLFNLGQHMSVYPEIYVKEKVKVNTSRLDSVLPKNAKFDYVALDVQGSELKAIEGLGQFLDQVKWIYTEVSREELYKDAPLVKDLDTYLSKKGFRRKFTAWDRKANWGDALYIHENQIKFSALVTIKSKFWQLSRFLRSYIPQFLFPTLVRIKHHLKK